MAHDEGRFVWFELLSDDKEAGQRFYGEVLPWKFSNMDVGGGESYTTIVVGEAPIGGFGKIPMEGVTPNWVSFVSVEDVDAAAKKIVEAGGKTLMDPLDLPAVGRMQYVSDNTGASFLVYRSNAGDNDPVTGEGSMHWNELWAQDPEKAVAFYENVLGYTHEVMPMPNGDYYVFKNGDKMRGGMMKSPIEGAPSFWLQYVHVTDCDAAVERAKRNGGELQGEIMDVPGVGRFGVVKDPLGALLGYITPGQPAVS